MPRIIAVLWDFDKTLITGYMQAPLFEYYGVDSVRFWDEVNALPAFHAPEGTDLLTSDFLYLNHMLTYVRRGVFAGLNNTLLRSFGAKQSMAPGIPQLFDHIAAFTASEGKFQSAQIEIEHYVISTGLRQIVLGSPVAPYMRYVWGCEFLEREAPPGFLDGATDEESVREIREIGYVIDHTSKTRAVFEINKGVREKLGFDVNSRMPRPQRRVPFDNMIYIADGPSDTPSLSLIRQNGGRTYGVFQQGSPRDWKQAKLLLDQERVDAIGPADYRLGSEAHSWLLQAVAEIADRIANCPAFENNIAPGAPPARHIYR